VKTTNHHELLRAYAQDHSESAFQELVNRYVDLVYSAAIRRVSGDRQLAEDVTQEVFTDLARKAAALPPNVTLGGWLLRHTGYVASTAMRGDQRRRDRERQAVEMNALNEPSEAGWRQFAPILDDAMDELDAADRDALVLRYFERCELRAVGAALGVSDDTAQKRVSRALDKLRENLVRRGVATTGAALSLLITANAVQAAPIGLAATISGIALAGAATGGGIALSILKIMSMTKLKVGIISALVVAGVAVPVVIHQQAQTELREAKESLRQQTEENQRLTMENEQVAQRAAPTSAPTTDSNSPSRELLQLRAKVGRLLREQTEAEAPVTRDAVEARYKHAQDLASRGDAAAALKEFLWCFDEGMPRVTGYGGVRTSFLLSEIAKLGEQYPDALAALRERRDKALQRMLASATDSDAAMEFSALNRALKQDQNTLAVFDQLPADDQRRQTLASSAYDQLVTAQRYGDALLGKSYAQISAQFEIMAAERPLPANIPNPEMLRKAQHDYLISSTAKNVEALAGAGDLEHARALAARVLAFDRSPEARTLLQQHAARAGQPELLDGLPNQ
jgi:RNA polymerase sigma factor (sigma-70 family)